MSCLYTVMEGGGCHVLCLNTVMEGGLSCPASVYCDGGEVVMSCV